MNKSLLTLILSLSAVLLLVLTNPRDEEHKAAVKTKLNAFMQKKLAETTNSSTDNFGSIGAGLGLMLGGYFVDKLIDTGVTRDNYLLFSITKVTFQGETKTIGLGVLGNVFLSSKIDEALKDKKSKE